jgi:enoyl-CoA hydratase/carnithine racemase
MTETPILRADHDGIALLTINRPARLNALNHAVIDGLMAAFDDIAVDDDIGAVILTGQGDHAFSAGADIYGLADSLAQGTATTMRDFVQRGQRFTARIEAFPKPIIVAVNGLAYGGGCEVVEAASLAIASDRARFAKPEIDLGFPPPFGGSQRLPRLIGRKRALAMILTGDSISAAAARDIGLINEVVPHDLLLDEARALARRIIAKGARPVAASLAAVTRGLNVAIGEGLAIEAGHFEALAATPGIAAGVRRFLDRRAKPAGW